MSRVIVIPTEGKPYEADFDLNWPCTEMRKVFGGKFVEQVRVNSLAANGLGPEAGFLNMLVDETGLLDNLPLNRVATPFYCPNPRDGIIAGPAVLVGTIYDPVEGDEWGPVPDSITPELVASVSFTVMLLAGVTWA